MPRRFPILATCLACGLGATAMLYGAADAQDAEPTTAPAEEPETPATAPAEALEGAPAQAEEPAATAPADSQEGFTRTETGLQYRITTPAGEPKTAQDGDVLAVHYTGELADGKVFDTSLRPRPAGSRMLVQPFIFKLGEGAVIAGWEQGLRGMKVGEKRTLIIPPELAYGEEGAGNVIPPNATLTFEVELIGLWRPESAEEGQQGQ